MERRSLARRSECADYARRVPALCGREVYNGVQTSTGAVDRWFVTGETPAAQVLLFCLPYAGGGASAYRAWASAFPSTVGVHPVQLPAREGRIAEPGGFDIAGVTDAILARADRPYAIYGHSMGGRLGFEVVRELRRRGARLPRTMYVAGSRAPDRAEPLSTLADADDATLIGRIVSMGGVPPEVFEEPELRDLALAVLRTDLTWISRYRYVEEEPLPVPLIAYAGEADPVAPVTALAAWARHTTGGFELRTVPGGHFFLREQLDRLAPAMVRDLIG